MNFPARSAATPILNAEVDKHRKGDERNTADFHRACVVLSESVLGEQDVRDKVANEQAALEDDEFVRRIIVVERAAATAMHHATYFCKYHK